MSGIKVVRAAGTPRSRGEQVGRELREEVKSSVDFYDRYFERRGISSEQLQELLTPYLIAAETHFPAYISVLEGMSIGATVPLLELFAINAFEELEPLLQPADGRTQFLEREEGHAAPSPGERCTSFVVTAEATTILAHNEHWLVGDAGNVAVVVDAPNDRPVSVASPTIVCCLPAVGMNSYGAGQGIASLTASDDRVGVPRVLVSRSSLEARGPAEAVAGADMPSRSGGYGHTFAFPGGEKPLVVETTAERVALVEGPPVHTNHYLSPELAPLGPEPSAESSVRYARVVELLGERRPSTVPDVMNILRDHATRPQAICQHADPAEGDEADAVLFSMVAELESGHMWVAPGNPCETEYEEIDLGDLR